MTKKEATKPRLLAVRDAAEYLAIGERAVWAMLSRGDLRSVKIGRRTLLDLRDLENLIETRKAASK